MHEVLLDGLGHLRTRTFRQFEAVSGLPRVRVCLCRRPSARPPGHLEHIPSSVRASYRGPEQPLAAGIRPSWARG
eukprot:11267918-Alexandrium_andersonii.AAC.1